ncbi:hypothetical protein C8Q76DRAFT_710288 [Earliella scabrosa]|nr:hypothetical protein C8Q76DRAFT_710288 [Earliella scabrosa]
MNRSTANHSPVVRYRPYGRPSGSSMARDEPRSEEEHTFELVVMLLRDSFPCPDLPALVSNAQPGLSVSFEACIWTAMKQPSLPPSTTYAALLLLHTLKLRHRPANRSPAHGFNSRLALFIAALMVASRVHHPRLYFTTWSQSGWSMAGQHRFSGVDTLALEKRLCEELNWHVLIPQPELISYQQTLKSVRSWNPRLCNPPPLLSSPYTVSAQELVPLAPPPPEWQMQGTYIPIIPIPGKPYFRVIPSRW